MFPLMNVGAVLGGAETYETFRAGHASGSLGSPSVGNDGTYMTTNVEMRALAVPDPSTDDLRRLHSAGQTGTPFALR